ncbi:GntR family transcriptional regulator [Thalassospira mesophila]|uniref:GntR family transcriptional regulator n=1 Tax=Thalassospira mesophila TaxID=1293891 RepID=A0A1Y2KXH7_9PROT|nr:GntR family transcriptional regulator [Thalassospira mesophila]OSQ35956.1 GntR family transcriptional regulator [Thalassospira mesophila]
MIDPGENNWSVSPDQAVGPQIHRIIRERIVCADLLPGVRISEAELARSYDVSRQPVREAFIKLADEGLLEIRPQRGTYVRKISVSSVLDARFVREAIEADIASYVASNPADGAIDRLRELIAAQRSAMKNDAKSFLSLDHDFHRCLAESAGKTYAWKVVEDVRAQLDRVRFLSYFQFSMEDIVAQHEAILTAIEAGDAQQAGAAMRRHTREILLTLPDIAKSRSELFDNADPVLSP